MLLRSRQDWQSILPEWQYGAMDTGAESGRESGTDAVLAAVGPRLRALRLARDITLSAVADATGISMSTLSRLESGQRRPNLELLLPLARGLSRPA